MRLRTVPRLATIVLAGILACASTAEAGSPAVGGASTAASAAHAAAADAPTRSQFRIRAVEDSWRASLPRAAGAATQAYLDRLPADVVARSNDYFEGGYWLQLWNFLLGLAVALILLSGRRAARLRDWAERVGPKPFLRDALFGALYSVAAWVLSLPLTIYQGYFREHQYAMATQSFGPWFTDQLTGLAVTMVLLALLAAVFYAVLRRVGASWWVWGTFVSVAFLVLLVLVAPVVIDPLFNTYNRSPTAPSRARC